MVRSMPLPRNPPRLASATAVGGGGAACAGGGGNLQSSWSAWRRLRGRLRSRLRRLQIVELSLEFLDFRLVVLLDISDFALQLFDLIVYRRRRLRQGRHRQDGASQTDSQNEFISYYANRQQRRPHR